MGALCASVIGPAHAEQSLPNQDAWARFGGAYGSGMVVCDGLGSAKHAEIGSRMACKAVAQAAALWSREQPASDEALLRLIHAIWFMKIRSLGSRDCASTCLFTLALTNGELLAAQLGDGMTAMHLAEGFRKLTPPRTGFANETTGLGIAGNVREWQVSRYKAEEAALVFLATDGVADDLIPELLPEFLLELRDALVPLAPRARNLKLRHELENWSAPGHSDDKTMAIMWRNPGTRSKHGS